MIEFMIVSHFRLSSFNVYQYFF